MTTNRISSIDRAFQSRVDLFLPYKDLVPEARRQVWINFFKHIGNEKFDVNEKVSQVSAAVPESSLVLPSEELLPFLYVA